MPLLVILKESKMKKWLFIVLILAGCATQSEKWSPKDFNSANQLATSMSSMNRTDKETIYKQYAGLVEVLKNCPKCIGNLNDLEDVVTKFHDDYAYSSEGKQVFNDSFVAFMSNNQIMDGMDSQDIVDTTVDNTQISRQKLIDVFQTVADAARLSLEKDNESK